MISKEVGFGIRAYVDTPEFFNRVKRDHFFQKIVPVVSLSSR